MMSECTPDLVDHSYVLFLFSFHPAVSDIAAADSSIFPILGVDQFPLSFL